MTDNGITLLNRYHLGEVLGQGGMGIVYRAHDSILERDVAIKVLSITGLGTEGRARLLREAQAAAALNHPNIITVHDTGVANIGGADTGEADLDRPGGDAKGATPFVIMELVEGQNLHDKPPRDLEQTLKITRQLCAALDHAHKHGIIHRDLKPENVLLTEDGTAKLVDFGLARSVTSRMTSEGTIVGTVFYMAPEQALGQEIDARTDLYALGVMLYELITGQLPFEDDSPVAVITQHLNAPVVPPKAIREDIPVYLDSLILRLLEKDPADRIESARAVAEILESPEKVEESHGVSKEHSVLDRIVRGRIVGRSQEYEEARSLWLETVSGSGQTLLISGEPGIGKTRLMRELVTQSEVSGGRVLIGEAYAESSTPYGAFAQIVHSALNGKSHNGLKLPDFVLDDVLDLAPELRPYYPDIESNPDLDPESAQRRLFENMVSFCNELSAAAPLLLVLDDAHWADSGSIALFQHLVRRTKKKPVMLLATYREVELREARPFNEMLLELNRQRLGTRIKLARLDREQTRDLLSAIFDEEITPDFLDGIYRETDGNPFFIEEVCRTLVESGELYFAEGEWHRPSMEDLEIPQGVQVAVESRLMKLPDDVQDTLRIAAVLGREFDYEVLIVASDLAEDSVIDAIEAADRAQMVQEGREDTLYEFVHALVPQSIRENTHRLRRRKLHKRAAAAYEKVQPENYESLSYHYGEGGNDSKALHYYILAGERALANYSNQDADNHFTAALNLTDDESERAMILAQLGKAQSRLSRPAESVETWQRSIDLYLKLGNKDEAAELYARSGRASWESGNTKGGLEICRQGLAALEGAEDGPGLARLFSETARACYFNGVRDELEQYADRALELAEQYDLPDVKADSLITLAAFKGSGSPEAIPMLEEAVEFSESADLVREAGRGLNNLGVLHDNLGDYQAAVENYRSAAEIARRTGQVGQQVFFLNNVISSQLFVGQMREAEEGYSALEPLLDQIPDPELGARIVRSSRGFYLFQKGEFEAAEQLLDQVIQADTETNDLYGLLNSLNGKSFILSISGNVQEAEKIIKQAIEIAEKLDEGEFQHLFASIAASVQGDVERAANHLESAMKIIGDSQLTFWRQLNILRAEGHLSSAEKDWEAAWTKFKDLDELQRGMNNLGIIHWTTTEWADAHLLRGQSDDVVRAKELFEQARSESETMGATGWVELIDRKLTKIENFP